ncbi:hypothetical protein BDC45DRAFT_572237 [Circinella umbellata]|nr:hypothetical protein BDC45DRAFT_572237 [Circinella umbellata]
MSLLFPKPHFMPIYLVRTSVIKVFQGSEVHKGCDQYHTANASLASITQQDILLLSPQKLNNNCGWTPVISARLLGSTNETFLGVYTKYRGITEQLTETHERIIVEFQQLSLSIPITKTVIQWFSDESSEFSISLVPFPLSYYKAIGEREDIIVNDQWQQQIEAEESIAHLQEALANMQQALGGAYNNYRGLLDQHQRDVFDRSVRDNNINDYFHHVRRYRERRRRDRTWRDDNPYTCYL